MLLLLFVCLFVSLRRLVVKQADWHRAILCPDRHPAKPSCLHLSLLVPSSWSPRWGSCLYSPVPPLPSPPLRWVWQPCSSEGSPGPASPSGVTLQNFLPLNRTGPKTRTSWLRPGAPSPLLPRARLAHAWVPVAPTYSHLCPPSLPCVPFPGLSGCPREGPGPRRLPMLLAGFMEPFLVSFPHLHSERHPPAPPRPAVPA